MIPNYEKKVILWSLLTIVFLFASFNIIVLLTRSANPFVMVRFDVPNDLKITEVLYDDVAEPIASEYLLSRKDYTIKLRVSEGGMPTVYLSIVDKSRPLDITGQYITKSSFENNQYYYSPHDNEIRVLEFAVIDDHGIVIKNESLPYEVVPAGIHYSYDLL